MSGFSAVPTMQEPIESNGTEEKAPKRRGRPPRDPNAPRRPRSSRSLKPQIAATLTMLNVLPATFPPTRNDALDTIEIDALATALDEQAKTSPQLRKMLEGFLSVTSGGQLIGVVAIIAARRAARHGLAPVEMDRQLGNMLAMAASLPPTPEPTPEQPPAPTAA